MGPPHPCWCLNKHPSNPLLRTQGGVNSLVGVAIAASLLPPLVNIGMCVAFGLVGVHRHRGMRARMFFNIAGEGLGEGEGGGGSLVLWSGRW